MNTMPQPPKKWWIPLTRPVFLWKGNSVVSDHWKLVKVKKKTVTLKKGQTFKIKAKVKKLKKKKKLMRKSHAAKVRYLCTNTKVATVSARGKIKGVSKGTCYIYAYAHNGVYKKIKVKVK